MHETVASSAVLGLRLLGQRRNLVLTLSSWGARAPERREKHTKEHGLVSGSPEMVQVLVQPDFALLPSKIAVDRFRLPRLKFYIIRAVKSKF